MQEKKNYEKWNKKAEFLTFSRVNVGFFSPYKFTNIASLYFFISMGRIVTRAELWHFP